MCTVLLPPGGYPTAVNKYIISSMAVFLKLGSAKGCQGFRGTKMHSGGTVLLAVINLYVGTKTNVETLCLLDRASS